jgi:hypothetical protein
VISLSIIIVNWNAGHQLRECVSSIGRASNNGFVLAEVIVVDNGSTDDSLSRVDQLGVSVKIIRNTENRGFGAACNQGAASATGEYFLFLNPDTVIFDNSLSAPLAFMQRAENAEVGIVGIQLVDENNCIARSCSRFPSAGTFVVHAFGINRLARFSYLSQPMVEWDHGDTRQVDQIMGAFFLIRRSVFSLLGGFDERFFVYFEEVDLSLRAKHEGWRSVYLTEARAYHKGGGVSENVKAHRIFYSLRSRIMYGFKHFGRVDAWIVCGVTFVVEPITRLLRGVARRSASELADTVRAFVMLWKDAPHILGTRKL